MLLLLLSGLPLFPICPLIDARKSEIYFSFYQPDGTGKVQLLAPYQVASPEQIADKIRGPTIFCGDGWPHVPGTILEETWRLGSGGSSPFSYHSG